MSGDRVTIVAPTDAQLSYIESLCEQKGFPLPAVYSKHHASLIISAILSGDYRPPDWTDDDDEYIPF